MNQQTDRTTRIDAAHRPAVRSEGDSPVFAAQKLGQSPAGTRPPRRVGLLAGWGRYPALLAESLHDQGAEVC